MTAAPDIAELWSGVVPYDDVARSWLRRRGVRPPAAADGFVVRFDRMVPGLFGPVPSEWPLGMVVVRCGDTSAAILAAHFDRPRPRSMAAVYAAVLAHVGTCGVTTLTARPDRLPRGLRSAGFRGDGCRLAAALPRPGPILPDVSRMT